MSELSDTALLDALRNDQPEAFLLYSERYGNLLFRFIVARVDSPQDAEEIHQDVVLKALDTWKPDGGSSLKSWLYLLARQGVADWKRRNSRRLRTESLAGLEVGVPLSYRGDAEAMYSGLRQRLRDAVDGLTRAERQIFELCFREDLSDPHIARILNYTENSVRTMRYRVLKKLRERVGGQVEAKRSGGTVE